MLARYQKIQVHPNQFHPVNAHSCCSFLLYTPHHHLSRLNLSDNAVEPLLEPFDGLLAVDAVAGADRALAAAAAGDALTGAGHAAVEVHAVDTNRGVVLDAEIDVLANTEAEVAGLAEVALAQLVLLDLEATLEDLLGLGATDGNVDGNLFVTTDTEGTDSVASLAYSLEKVVPSAMLFPSLSLFFLLLPSPPPSSSSQRHRNKEL